MNIPPHSIEVDPLNDDANSPTSPTTEIVRNDSNPITVQGSAYPREAIRMADLLLDCLG